MKILQPYLSRIIAIVAAALGALGAAKFGSAPDLEAELVKSIVGLGAVGLGIYAATHKTVSKATNPSDDATSGNN